MVESLPSPPIVNTSDAYSQTSWWNPNGEHLRCHGGESLQSPPRVHTSDAMHAGVLTVTTSDVNGVGGGGDSPPITDRVSDVVVETCAELSLRTADKTPFSTD